MATELALKAKDAFFDDDYDLAVDLLTQASNRDPANADLYADRSQAHIKLNNFTEAVADANKAIQLDPTIASAYYRKGIACVKLEEYHTAKAALEKGASLSEDDSKFTKFIKECDQKIAEEIPEIASSVSRAAPVSVETTEVEQINTIEVKEPKYRHGHYQSAQEVVVTIYAKGVPAEHVTVDFGEQILSVTIDVPGEDPYHFQPRLFGKEEMAGVKKSVGGMVFNAGGGIINWFPGHMAAATRAIRDRLKVGCERVGRIKTAGD